MDDTQRQEIAENTARTLFDIGAIHFNAKDPFTFTSGRKSPVYVDCRKPIAFPDARNKFIEDGIALLETIKPCDYIAGGETAGIPYAAWMADRLNKPMLYVRKKPKGFGRMAQIEGHMEEGGRVLLVEDLASEGSSKLNFCDALRDAGAEISDIFVIFYYDIFHDSIKALEDKGLILHYLATWWDALSVARQDKRFDETTLDEVEKFLKAPDDWEAAA